MTRLSTAAVPGLRGTKHVREDQHPLAFVNLGNRFTRQPFQQQQIGLTGKAQRAQPRWLVAQHVGNGLDQAFAESAVGEDKYSDHDWRDAERILVRDGGLVQMACSMDIFTLCRFVAAGLRTPVRRRAWHHAWRVTRQSRDRFILCTGCCGSLSPHE